ncbi:TonB-dependent receptor [Parerythrobacter aestuarii]|uniref:TonB-dependent receptor n=1 Tax=Parerythrobacter aestuarii TaxID=3020909 RepID=UPI0024DE719F|nr:TonB-dependent receptor [Parerythrobacter aestuarii]
MALSRRTTDTNSVSRRVLALGTASSIALCATLATPVYAQDAEEEPAAEGSQDDSNIITVTGFRASLQNSQSLKQNADTFVDAITAEDIGALPDRSVAEALQRVPGVNIGRFEKTTDPDRFSVEGTGVIIRGLPYTRSELNGREIFSATGGRVLSFEDVSPELLGRVEVFKNVTADMVEGAIAGTVNLVTRKPLDNRGVHIAGSIEGNYGDLRDEWSPTFNLLGSATVDSDKGTLGVQLAYSKSKLKSRTDATQIADPCYRDPSYSGDCLRVLTLTSGGFSNQNFDESNFPPAGAVVVPKGAGVRTTDLDREREAWAAVVQYENPTGDFLITMEWLRSETSFDTEEFAFIAPPAADVDGLFPVPRAGSTWTFDDNGVFQSGVLTQRPGDAYATPFGWGGLNVEALRFVRSTKSVTEDFSFDLDWSITDRLRVNFEAQHIDGKLRRDSVFGATRTWADVALDLSGNTPSVEFLAPMGAPDDYFTSGFYSYYWFGLDSREKNEGEMDSLRFDAEYDISDEGFFKSARFGARWADRDRTTRNTNFSTWGNLSAPWAGRAGCAPWGEGPGCFQGPGPYVPDWSGFTPGRFYTGLPGQEFAIAGGVYTDEFPDYSSFRAPFGDGFQRGNTPIPVPGGGSWFFGGDDFLGEYLAGITDQQIEEIQAAGVSPERFNYGVNGRTRQDPFNPLPGNTVPCDIEGFFCPTEVSTVGEITKAAYARIDFGTEFSNGWVLDGNFGMRYVETKIDAPSIIAYPDPGRFDDVGNGGNGDGVVQVAEIQTNCAGPVRIPGAVRGYCDPAFAPRLAEFAAAHTGEFIRLDQKITFDQWLPSFNAKLDVGGGLLFRAAVSKGISRPDLQLLAINGAVGDNTGALLEAGTLTTGPLFTIRTGNRNLLPVKSWNFDLSAEWYFDDVGSLTASVFLKDISGIVSNGFEVRELNGASSPTAEYVFQGPFNDQSGQLKGFEIAYQQTWDFLPGLLSGFGGQFTYTYVDGSDFSNPNLAAVGQSSVTTGTNELGGGAFTAGQPLAGISKHTINATLFYEKGPFAARAAYNWRSAFLITPRDDIIPFSPIWQESTGQLDASVFYAVTDNIKVGVQAVNLLDEVTRTSQVVNFDGLRVPRSAFRNDRRYTLIARFDF